MTVQKYLIFIVLLSAVLMGTACADTNSATTSPQVTPSEQPAVEDDILEVATVASTSTTLSATATPPTATATSVTTHQEPKVKSTPNTPPQPQKPGKVAPRDDPPPPAPAELARFDLAERFGIDIADITVQEVTLVSAKDVATDCLKSTIFPDSAFEVTEIRLGFKNRIYIYLAINDGVVFCSEEK